MGRGSIINIQRYSLHDGEGIRTTVFLKGCPLRCAWCHNPESQARVPERVHRADRCIRCGRCVAACTHGALRLDEQGPVRDAGLCTLDGRCAAACPAEATELIGRTWDVAEVMDVVRRDQVFYDESHGGVTFSGGEPLHQPEFLRALLLACRSESIRTTIDTCGHAAADDVESIIPMADAVLFDVKHPDDEMHRTGTGVGNRLIMDNLLRVRRITAESGAALTVRVPLIAGWNDGDEDVRQLTALLLALHPAPPVDLLPCHDHATGKYQRLGRPAPRAWRAPALERQHAIAASLSSAGLDATIRGENA